MQYRPLGSSGLMASVVAFGAWAAGGWRWGGQDEAEAVRAMHASFDAGINLIDTAPLYGYGKSEVLVGKAIADRRDQVIIASKCGLRWNTDSGTTFFIGDDFGMNPESGQYRVQRFLGPESIRDELETSLFRLRTDYIDLYQTHWQDVTTPIEDTMAELLKLKEEGKIRAIGVSNATPKQMDIYRKLGVVDTDQERYSMLDRDMDAEQLAYCRDNNIAFLAYSPLHHGLLTGKVTRDRTFGKGDLRNDGRRFTDENLDRTRILLDAFEPVADARNLTMAQLVIAWTIAQPGVTHALVGARTPQQAVENAAAGSVQLTPSELDTIDAAIAEYGGDIE